MLLRPEYCRDRPMDPLSQLLGLSGAQAVVSTGLAASGRWCVDVPAAHVLKCNILRQGACLLEVNGKRHTLAAGDCFLVAPHHPFRIGNDFSWPLPAEEVFAGSRCSLYARLDRGEDSTFRCLGGRMELGPAASLLTDSLPPVIILSSDMPASGRISWLLDRLEEEHGDTLPGTAAVGASIMQLIFIELIRTLPKDAPQGWLAGLADPQIGMALKSIHADPAHPWRLESLARRAHLSRSQFAARFRKIVGRAPMEYLLHWRVALARHALANPGMTVAKVATDVGYASESAFGAAFRRVTGTSPRRAVRQAASASCGE